MQSQFEELFKNSVKDLMNSAKDTKLNRNVLDNNNLPSISIVTPTYNRKRMFRLPVFIYNTMDYPKEKMEWIIIDDSNTKEDDSNTKEEDNNTKEEDNNTTTKDNSVRDLIPDKEYLRENNMDINYIRLDKKLTIGAKRNIGCEVAKHNIIMFMDDDDYYYKTSFKNRVNALINSGKNCVGTSIYGCFEINRYISIINLPSIELKHSKRVSMASLCFNKSYWLDNRFLDTNENEGVEFIRLFDYCDISWENNMIALIHSSNVMKDKISDTQESNGCHFKFTDKLFNFLITLDKNSDIEDKLKEKE